MRFVVFRHGGKLTTHVLDTANGCPAVGIKIELSRIDDSRSTLLKTVVTNGDGLGTDAPLLTGEEFSVGEYELVFHVGDYFSSKDNAKPDARFLNLVPVRFHITNADSTYHIPLLCSPWAYSTYRGS